MNQQKQILKFFILPLATIVAFAVLAAFLKLPGATFIAEVDSDALSVSSIGGLEIFSEASSENLEIYFVDGLLSSNFDNSTMFSNQAHQVSITADRAMLGVLKSKGPLQLNTSVEDGEVQLSLLSNSIQGSMFLSGKVEVKATPLSGNEAITRNAISQVPIELSFETGSEVLSSFSLFASVRDVAPKVGDIANHAQDCKGSKRIISMRGQPLISGVSYGNPNPLNPGIYSTIKSGRVLIMSTKEVFDVFRRDVVSTSLVQGVLLDFYASDCGVSSLVKGEASSLNVGKLGATTEMKPSILEWLTKNPTILLLSAFIGALWAFFWGLRDLYLK